MSLFKDSVQMFWGKRQTLVFILTPICLLPLLLTLDSQEAGCGYGVGVMVVYWVTETVPLAVTSLLPLLLFPLMGLSHVADVSMNYINDDSIMVMSCLAVGVAMEKSRLGRRVALWTLMRTGSNPTWLMLGLMVVTWLLSLWLDPPSTTCVVLPFLSAILRQLKDTNVKRSPSLLARQVVQKAMIIKPTVSSGQWRSLLSSRRHSKKSENRKSKEEEEITRMIIEEDDLDTKMSPATSPATYRRICKGLSLCVAYAANIGGACRLSGSSPYLIMQQQARQLFEHHGMDSGLTEGRWMVFALPASVLCLLLAWLWLSLLFLGPKQWRKKKRIDKVKAALIKETLSRQYQKLRPMSFAEKAVLGHFLLLVCLLLSADPPVVPGWLSLFPPRSVTGSTAAILVCLSLFVFPAERPRSFFWRSGSHRGSSVESVLDWRSMQSSFPWEILLLMGGGHAIAHVWGDTGLWRWIIKAVGEGRGGGIFPWLLSAVLTALLTVLTQITGSVSAAHRLTPIIFSIAINHQVNPLYFLLPCAMATSLTFLLPIATPPNAIVFATGHLEVKDMILAGLVMHVLLVLVLSLATNTWGVTYFHLNSLPPQFFSTTLNATMSSWSVYNSTTTAPTAIETQTFALAQSTLSSSSFVTDVMNATTF